MISYADGWIDTCDWLDPDSRFHKTGDSIQTTDLFQRLILYNGLFRTMVIFMQRLVLLRYIRYSGWFLNKWLILIRGVILSYGWYLIHMTDLMLILENGWFHATVNFMQRLILSREVILTRRPIWHKADFKQPLISCEDWFHPDNRFDATADFEQHHIRCNSWIYNIGVFHTLTDFMRRMNYPDQWFEKNCWFYPEENGRKVGGIRYKARSRGRSSPETLAFWAYETPRR